MNEGRRLLKAAGYRFVRRCDGSHEVWHCPHGCCGEVLSSMGDFRAIKNMRARINRCPGRRAAA